MRLVVMLAPEKIGTKRVSVDKFSVFSFQFSEKERAPSGVPTSFQFPVSRKRARPIEKHAGASAHSEN
jgi:hypothetical protein